MAIDTEEIKEIIGTEEMKNYKVLLRQLFAEFLGTFLYLALISLSIFPKGTSTLTTAMSNGLTVGSVIQIIGHISGGHINPAVTIGVLVTNQIKMLRALCYVAAQVLGAIAGTLLSSAIMNKKSDVYVFSDVPDYSKRTHDIKNYQILLLECLMTSSLVLVVLSVVDTKRGARGLGSAALAIGLCLAACLCSCQFYPPKLNPALALGVAVARNVWTHHWAYWLGPISGGICAGLIYKFVFTLKLRNFSDG